MNDLCWELEICVKIAVLILFGTGPRNQCTACSRIWCQDCFLLCLVLGFVFPPLSVNMFVKVYCWERKQRRPGWVNLVVKEVKVREEQQREGKGRQMPFYFWSWTALCLQTPGDSCTPLAVGYEEVRKSSVYTSEKGNKALQAQLHTLLVRQGFSPSQ